MRRAPRDDVDVLPFRSGHSSWDPVDEPCLLLLLGAGMAMPGAFDVECSGLCQ